MGEVAYLEKVDWLGHSSIFLRLSKKICIDPYQINPKAPKADLILITHSHYDHFSVPDIKTVLGDHTWIIAPEDCAIDFTTRVLRIAVGLDQTAMGVHVTAVPAYNIVKKFHARSSQKVGYVIEMDGMTFYHAGDTDFIPEMKDIKCDVAFLPIGGTYTMSWEEAWEAIQTLQAKVIVPIHWGSIVGSREDALALVRKDPNRIALMPRTIY